MGRSRLEGRERNRNPTFEMLCQTPKLSCQRRMWVSDLGFGERMELRMEGSASICFTRAVIKMSHSSSKYSLSTYYSPSPALGTGVAAASKASRRGPAPAKVRATRSEAREKGGCQLRLEA